MSVLAVAEHRRGALRGVTHELATAGRALAEELDERLHVAVIGGDYADEVAREGVDVIHEVAAGAEFNHDEYVQALAALVPEIDPSVLLLPHTVHGLDYAPAVASRLDRPLVTDAVDLAAEDALVVTRELYGSKVETTLAVHADRAAVTVRPGEWPAADRGGDPAVEAVDPGIERSAIRTSVTGYEAVGTGDVDISEADVLVAVGRGIGEEANLDLIFDLAEAMDATVAASRPVVDNGWLPPARQVGQSGKVVTPEVYLAVGISGAVQHVAGMKGADTIVAINDDPSAPIFDLADYGIVDDLFDVVPALTDAFEA